MRIDAYNQVAQLYGAQRAYNTQKTNKAASMGNDQVSISQAGYSYQAAKTAVAEASEVREEPKPFISKILCVRKIEAICLGIWNPDCFLITNISMRLPLAESDFSL